MSASPPDAPTAARTAPPLWLVLGAFGVVYVIWGSTYLGIRLAIDSLPPLLMAGSRFLLAGLVLYGVMRLRGAPRPDGLQWRDAAVVGALLLLAGNGAVSWAEKTVPTNIAALIIASTPLWINLLDWLRPGGRRPHGLVFGGLALGFSGVALIIAGRDRLGHSVVEPVGALVLLGAALLWAAGSLFSRHARQSSPALLAVAMQMITGGALLLGAGLGVGEWGQLDFARVTRASAWAFVYLTFFGSLLGFTAYVWLLQVSTPARVSTYAFVNPLIAVVLGRVLLGEELPRSVLLAGLLILVAVVLITLRRRTASG